MDDEKKEQLVYRYGEISDEITVIEEPCEK
jgi:hypothetical protein